MDGETCETRFLSRSRDRTLGAMFQRGLGRRILVFLYPRAERRLFHTFFCPPLRILALSGEGERLQDGLWPKNRLVRLPATRLVVECDPGLKLTPSDFRSIAAQAELLLAEV